MIYAAFGLKFLSDIELPLLESAQEGDYDFVIRVKKTPERIEPIINRGVYFQANSREFLLKVPDAGTIFVKAGREIWVEAGPGQLEVLKLYLLSSALGALFQQRGWLSIHASCVTNHKRTILITGLSGSGKSTVSTALLNEGFEFVSDDICLLRIHQNRFVIEPGAPYIKLWQDTLEKLGIDHRPLKPVREGLGKYYYIPPCVSDVKLPVSHVFALQGHNKPDPEITGLQGMQKFNVMKNNLLRPQFLRDTDNHPIIFQQYNRFLSQTKVYQLKRPSGHHIHPKLIGMILHEVQ